MQFPCFLQRFEIVNGVVEVDGATNEAAMDQEEDKAAEGTCECYLEMLFFLGAHLYWYFNTFDAEKGVPDFWLNAMKNNEVLAEEVCHLSVIFWLYYVLEFEPVKSWFLSLFWFYLNQITERDEGALKYLKDIKWCRIEDPKGFKLEFFFDTNPYFKNSVLTKTYHMIDEDEPILEKAIG